MEYSQPRAEYIDGKMHRKGIFGWRMADGNYSDVIPDLFGDPGQDAPAEFVAPDPLKFTNEVQHVLYGVLQWDIYRQLSLRMTSCNSLIAGTSLV